MISVADEFAEAIAAVYQNTPVTLVFGGASEM
jgi:hypothetical protein